MHVFILKILANIRAVNYTNSMGNNSNLTSLTDHIKPGNVYRRESLQPYSNAVDRHLRQLTQDGLLQKIAPGLYYASKMSRFGQLPPNDHCLVKAFLRDDNFLLFSHNAYNSLNLGLTQVYNHTIVYNHKRHGQFKLGNKTFDFRRPTGGFPKKLTAAFLLVDLFNHANELADENIESLKEKVKTRVNVSLLNEAKRMAKCYGKVATKKFFSAI
tara:strand:- start:21064 stop:21705 length:642 start_codon:yes stop_codon:yes gene_type:complete